MRHIGDKKPLLPRADYVSKPAHYSSRMYHHPHYPNNNPALFLIAIVALLSCQILTTTTTVVNSLSLPASSSSTNNKKVVLESRRSILKSRIPRGKKDDDDENGPILGWTLEQKIKLVDSVDDDDNKNKKTLEVSVHWCHHHDNNAPLQNDIDNENINTGIRDEENNASPVIQVSLPLNDDDEEEQGLSCYLWPSAIAGSILLTSPLYRSFLQQKKDILELGSGLGLAGMVAAASAAAGRNVEKKCVLTDRDEYTVKRLQDMICQNKNKNKKGIPTPWEECDLSASILDWRDFVGGLSKEEEDAASNRQYDVILGTDLAYYHHLIRPLLDVSKYHLKKVRSSNDDDDDNTEEGEGGMLCIVGQANRESQWDLYKSITSGSYNQITDQHEGPWNGSTCLLLYDLGIGPWEEKHNNNKQQIGEIVEQGSSLEWKTKEMEEIVPIAALLHSMSGRDHKSLIGPYDKIATKEDEKDQMMSF